ncbi:MAG: Calx-beta domain-containing protein [Gammaproteobacteria bacterium]
MIKHRYTSILIVAASVFCTASLALAAVPPGPAAPSASEHELQRLETVTLGAAHAAEHAQARTERSASQLLPARDFVATSLDQIKTYIRTLTGARTQLPAGLQAVLNELIGPAQALPGTPDQVGQWGATISVPVIGIHATLLPTGKILFWSYRVPKYENQGVAYLWNPADGTGRSITPPNNIWCAGQALLADGRVLIVGGNLAFSNATESFKGLNQIYTFNPFDETWTRQPDMRSGRWYPTVTALADGRAVITQGMTEAGNGAFNQDVEIFTPSASLNGVGTLQVVGTRNISGLYPHQFVMPDGRMLLAGPRPDDTALFNPTTAEWSDIPDFAVHRYLYGSAVLVPNPAKFSGTTQVMLIGGGDGNAQIPTATTELFDTANHAAGWSFRAPLPQPRTNNNTVILPDGTLLTVGGNNSAKLFENPQYEAELYNPATDTWSAMASQTQPRAYHSTALLLPDGRVLSAGDDGAGGDRLNKDGDGEGNVRYANDALEIFSPTYLFRGTRPTISAAPAQIAWGESFAISTPNAITQAVLVAPGATTHGNNMHQRYVPLALSGTTGTVTVTAPPNANVAPPGYYMLFVLNSQGVPSVAKWVKLGASTANPGTLHFSLATYDTAEESGTATITVTREGGTAGNATVNFTTGDNTALAGLDYTATAGQLNFAAGAFTPQTFTVPIINDITPESSETVNLSLSAPTGATLVAPTAAALTIIDNDNTPPTLQFESDGYHIIEQGGMATITVTRSGATHIPVSVGYTTANGTATAGSDYTAVSGTLNFAANDTAKTFTVPIIVDTKTEPDETVNLTLSNPSGGAVLGPQQVSVLTIVRTGTVGEGAALPKNTGGGQGGGGGGGGCSLSSQATVDPVLPLLVLLAGIALAWRRRAGQRVPN